MRLAVKDRALVFADRALGAVAKDGDPCECCGGGGGSVCCYEGMVGKRGKEKGQDLDPCIEDEFKARVARKFIITMSGSEEWEWTQTYRSGFIWSRRATNVARVVCEVDMNHKDGYFCPLNLTDMGSTLDAVVTDSKDGKEEVIFERHLTGFVPDDLRFGRSAAYTSPRVLNAMTHRYLTNYYFFEPRGLGMFGAPPIWSYHPDCSGRMTNTVDEGAYTAIGNYVWKASQEIGGSVADLAADFTSADTETGDAMSGRYSIKAESAITVLEECEGGEGAAPGGRGTSELVGVGPGGLL